MSFACWCSNLVFCALDRLMVKSIFYTSKGLYVHRIESCRLKVVNEQNTELVGGFVLMKCN